MAHFITGASVRADTTLIGFDQNDWQRGNRSYVFKGGGTVMCLKIAVIDREIKHGITSNGKQQK